MNIYGPNYAPERKLIWSMIVGGIPKLDKWLLGGDYNMLESNVGKFFVCVRLLGEQKRCIWNVVKESQNVEDSFF